VLTSKFDTAFAHDDGDTEAKVMTKSFGAINLNIAKDAQTVSNFTGLKGEDPTNIEIDRIFGKPARSYSF
jgi:hypothetical protein